MKGGVWCVQLMSEFSEFYSNLRMLKSSTKQKGHISNKRFFNGYLEGTRL